MVAALAMRKLQALHLLSTPGVRTTTDVVVTIVQDIDRALIANERFSSLLVCGAHELDSSGSVPLLLRHANHHVLTRDPPKDG